MTVPRLASLTLAALPFLALAACDGLKVADQNPTDGDGGPSETPGDADAAADDAASDAGRDAGSAPIDVACSGDPWTKATKKNKDCEARQVRVVAAEPPSDPTGISIARTPNGRVGIVYNGEQGSDTGEMNLVHFVPKAPGFAEPVLVKRATGFAFHDGQVAKITASAPDRLHILAHDVDDGSQSGGVNLYTLSDGKEALSGPELVASSVRRPTELAVRADAAGNIYGSIRIANGATTAKLTTFKRTSNGVSKLPDLSTVLLPAEGPGIGAAAIVVDPTSIVHLLFHDNEVQNRSVPRYHTLDGANWSSRKTVDNAALDGFSGFSPALAVVGNTKYAVYYFRKAGQTAPATADLRLATWQSTMDLPQIEVLDQGIPSSDPLDPHYRVAMAADKYGLLHLAIIRPTAENNSAGYLEYRRQAPVAGGGIKWLSDIVDPDVVSAGSEAYVDLVVDADARPHIAYISAIDGLVRYATRFDR